MHKKIAKKFVLITLLFLIILGGVATPVVSFKTAIAAPSSTMFPKKTAEVPLEGDGSGGVVGNSCPTCFTAAGPKINSI
jgi:hypothetical protein